MQWSVCLKKTRHLDRLGKLSEFEMDTDATECGYRALEHCRGMVSAVEHVAIAV